MDQMTPAMDHYLAEFARVQARLPGGGGTADERKAGLRAFTGHGFPTQREEDWKYTDLRSLAKQAFEVSDRAGDIAEDALADYCPEAMPAYRAVIVDGHFADALSQLDGLPAGVRIVSFATHLNDAAGAHIQHPEIGEQPGSLTAMNAAFVTDGVHVELEAGAVLDKPLHVVTLASGADEQRMAQVRHRYVLGDNSQAEIIEHYVGLGEAACFTNAVTEAVTRANAQLTRCRLQEESVSGYHVSSFFAQQARDSRIYNHSFDLGGGLARIDTNTRLTEPNAEIGLYGVYAPNGRQHMDNHTRVDHVTDHGISREIFKGVLAERGRGVFNGKIVVHKDAQQTDSEQSSAALLLSKRAEVDAKPELEIYADDVKATHGSTVGQLDEDAVFYLQSRGVDETGARAILTYSFARELVQMLGNEALEAYIESALMAKLPGGRVFANIAS